MESFYPFLRAVREVSGRDRLGVFECYFHLTGGPFVQVAFPGHGDGEADRGPIPGRGNVVELECWGEYKVTLFRDD